MIVTRTPLRVSLFGGGSDIPQFYQHERGAVLSFTIDKYIHVALQDVAPKHYKIMYSEVEQVYERKHIKHELVKACLDDFNHPGHVEIASFADIPTKGTGLGSSSSFAVGLLNALYSSRNRTITKPGLAEHACRVELYNCGKPIGKQDQYAAAIGGCNMFMFDANEDVEIRHLSYVRFQDLEKHLHLIYTGVTRRAESILETQVARLKNNDQILFKNTKMLRDQAKESEICIREGEFEPIGPMLNQAWEVKKSVSPNVSSFGLDSMHLMILDCGATGAKLLGAGGGGYFVAYTPFDKHSPRGMEFAKQFGDDYLQFKITQFGSTVLFND